MQEQDGNKIGIETGIAVEQKIELPKRGITATTPGMAEPGMIVIRNKMGEPINLLPSKDSVKIGENGGVLKIVNGQIVEEIVPELTDAKQATVMITLARRQDVPAGLRKKEDEPAVVMGEKRGKDNIMYNNLRYTEGGYTLVTELEEKGWICSDAYWKEVQLKDVTRYRVYVCMRPPGEGVVGVRFSDKTLRGLIRLLGGLYTVMVFDNRFKAPNYDVFIHCVFTHLNGVLEGETKHIFVSKK